MSKWIVEIRTSHPADVKDLPNGIIEMSISKPGTLTGYNCVFGDDLGLDLEKIKTLAKMFQSLIDKII